MNNSSINTMGFAGICISMTGIDWHHLNLRGYGWIWRLYLYSGMGISSKYAVGSTQKECAKYDVVNNNKHFVFL